MRPTPGPKSIYFAVEDVDEVHTRAKSLDALAPFQVHGQLAGDVVERPWGERSFYVTDPWGNALCFAQEGNAGAFAALRGVARRGRRSDGRWRRRARTGSAIHPSHSRQRCDRHRQ